MIPESEAELDHRMILVFSLEDATRKVSDNFRAGEFATGDEPYWFVHPWLISKLQRVRDTLGKPIRISSGYRDEAHNTRVGGAKASQHMAGRAADIVPPEGVTTETLMGYAYYSGFRRIARMKRNVHVDTVGAVPGEGMLESGDLVTWRYRGCPPPPTQGELRRIAEELLR